MINVLYIFQKQENYLIVTGDKKSPAANSCLAKVTVQWTTGSFVVNQTFVLRINPDWYGDGKNHHLLVAANRYQQFLLKCFLSFSNWKLNRNAGAF